MNHLTPLYQQPFFWAALLTPIFIGLTLGIIIYSGSELEACPSYICFNNFIVYFKVPLGVSALCFPLVALVISSHRSKQTAEQIKSSDSQNIFSNFYKHQEEFIKCIKTLEERHNLKCDNYLELYTDLFPGNSPKKVIFTEKEDKFIGVTLRIAKSELTELTTIINDENIDVNLTKIFFIRLARIGPILHMVSNDFVEIDSPENGYPPNSKLYIGFSNERPLEHFYNILFVIEHLMAFCGIDDSAHFVVRNNPMLNENAIGLFDPPRQLARAKKRFNME